MFQIRNFGFLLSPFEKWVICGGITIHLLLLYRFQGQMGDFGDYAKAGELIWNDKDPYSRLMYVNSPVSAILVFGLSYVFPFLFIPAVWQILNMLGLWLFLKVFLRPDLAQPLFVAVMAASFFNSTRALYGNVQVTGLVLGLIACAQILFNLKKSVFLASFPLWAAFEIKPQLALGFLVFFLFFEKVHMGRALVLGAYVFVSHLSIEKFFDGDIHKLWIQKIDRYSANAFKEGYEISIWKSMAKFFGHQPLLETLASLVTVVVLIAMIFFALKSKGSLVLLLAIIFPLQNPYLHLYDLAPIGILLAVALSRNHLRSLAMGLLLFLQLFPLEVFPQVLIVILFCLALLRSDSVNSHKTPKIVMCLFVALLSSISLYTQRNLSQEMQMANSLVIPLVVVLSLNFKRIMSMFEQSLAKEAVTE